MQMQHETYGDYKTIMAPFLYLPATYDQTYTGTFHNRYLESFWCEIKNEVHKNHRNMTTFLKTIPLYGPIYHTIMLLHQPP
jgi:hypothetical protein